MNRLTAGCVCVLLATGLSLAGELTSASADDTPPTEISVGPAALVSYATDGEQVDSYAFWPQVTAGGDEVLFYSAATDLGARNSNDTGLYSRNLITGVTQRVDIDSDGKVSAITATPAATADGRYIAFVGARQSCTTDSDTKSSRMPVFVRDLQTETSSQLAPCGLDVNDVAMSGDGRWVAWDGTDAANDSGIWVDDTSTGETGEVLSGLSGARNLTLSANGQVLAFLDADRHWQIFDIASSTLTPLVTASGKPIQDSPDWSCATPQMFSRDGRYFLFNSKQTGITPGDLNGNTDAFVYDRVAGDFERQTVTSGGSPAFGCGSAISPNGRYVLFDSNYDQLNSDGATTDGLFDYLRDRQTDTLERVTSGSDRTSVVGGAEGRAMFSPDGAVVAFESSASDIVLGDLNSQGDIFEAPLANADLSTPTASVATGELTAHWESTHSASSVGRYSGSVRVRYLPGDIPPGTRTQGKLAYSGKGTHITLHKLSNGKHYSFAIFRMGTNGKALSRQVVTAAPARPIATKLRATTAHKSVRKGVKIVITATLKSSRGKAVPGQPIALYRRSNSGDRWVKVTLASSDGRGQARFHVTVHAGQQFQARHAATTYFASSKAQLAVHIRK